jgi:hypothetical protein
MLGKRFSSTCRKSGRKRFVVAPDGEGAERRSLKACQEVAFDVVIRDRDLAGDASGSLPRKLASPAAPLGASRLPLDFPNFRGCSTASRQANGLSLVFERQGKHIT